MKNIQTQFYGLFDASKSLLYFHIKIKNVDIMDYHMTEEILDRLKRTYELFKHRFFEYNKILLVSMHDFVELSPVNMIKYIEYIFNKINSILKNYIMYFELYENYRQQLISILDPNTNIDIEMLEVNSDIEIDDINFINL